MKNSINNKVIKNSLFQNLMLSQLIKIHMGIKNVVSVISDNDKPSIPMRTSLFIIGSVNIGVMYWNPLIVLSHSHRRYMFSKNNPMVYIRVTIFCLLVSLLSIKYKFIIPMIGKINSHNNNGGFGIWTQDLLLAMQTLYLWANPPL